MIDLVDILLVDDNMVDAEMTILALKRSNLGNRLLHLEDGDEALEFLFGRGQFHGRMISHTPKLILLDLKMPKMSGMEVLRRIKTDQLTRKIPVVILTASQEFPDIRTCYQLGVNGYVVKPVIFDQYNEAIVNIGTYWMKVNHPPI
jgi:two-component system response regulator